MTQKPVNPLNGDVYINNTGNGPTNLEVVGFVALIVALLGLSILSAWEYYHKEPMNQTPVCYRYGVSIPCPPGYNHSDRIGGLTIGQYVDNITLGNSSLQEFVNLMVNP